MTIAACASLDEVRANINRLDDQLVALVCERAGYVEQAARFKPQRADVVVPERIEAIIRRMRAAATDHGGDPDLIEAIWRAMIAAFIAHEAKVWDRIAPPSP